MTTVFLVLHVLAAIIAIGPIAVAGSLFPRAVRQLAAAGPSGAAGESDVGAPGGTPGRAEALANARLLHRITKIYAVVGAAIPAMGLIVAIRMNILGHGWLLTSIALTLAAALVLAFLVLPHQARVVESAELAQDVDASSAARLAMLTGTFNLLWFLVAVLMVAQPRLPSL